jgi:2-(1,2-epoxy-1,2-dihydrophenyl)acetyl-CoA isomerase
MPFESILYDVRDRVATITLNRPEVLNAFGPETMQELLQALHQAEDDPQVGCVVLTGAGRAFCSGADVRGFQEAIQQQGPRLASVALESGPQLMFNMKTPIIAAINGPAVGLGATLPLPCDMRIASDWARIGFIFARVGLIPEFGSSFFLSRIVGLAKAKELVFTARIIEAEEALSIGLVSKVVVHDRLMEETMAMASAIAQGPTRILGLAKEVIHRGLTSDLAEAERQEAEGLGICQRSPEHAEGVKAFLEKRQPQFHKV